MDTQVHPVLDPMRILGVRDLQIYHILPPAKKHEFLYGRYALQRAVSSAFSEDEVLNFRVEIALGGKPSGFVGSKPVYCSISHSRQFVVGAVSSRIIGVDIEHAVKRDTALLRAISNQDEISQMYTIVPESHIPTVLWCLKESAAKADVSISPLVDYQVTLHSDGYGLIRRGPVVWLAIAVLLADNILAITIPMAQISESELADVMKELFEVQAELSTEADLLVYIKDSIDLGELLAVVHERYQVVPTHPELLKTHSRMGDVVRILNNDFPG